MCERCERTVVVILTPHSPAICSACQYIEQNVCPYEYSCLFFGFIVFSLWFLLTYPYYY